MGKKVEWSVDPAEGQEVFWSPEFLAFAKRFGIDMTRATKVVTIRIALGEMLTVTEEYLAGPKFADPHRPEPTADPTEGVKAVEVYPTADWCDVPIILEDANASDRNR